MRSIHGWHAACEAMNTTHEPAAALLEVKGLKTYFFTRDGVVRAVDDMSFSVERGETLAIVGESGCGKSVTSLSILRLIACPPGRTVQGQVLFEGRDLLELSEPQMRRIRGDAISMIFQEPMTSLNPVLTIGRQIAEVLMLHRGLSRDEAVHRSIDMLRLVRISEPERSVTHYPHQLSGGMRQRVMIAMALACEPRLLIADEPTTALDVTTQAQVLALLDRLVDEHETAVILITHNLGIVSDFCDSVAVMYAGRFVETSDVDHIFTRPTHPYSEALLKCVPNPERLAEGPLPAITGFPPDLSRLPRGCSFAPRCPIGKDLPECHEQAPTPHIVSEPAGTATVECHFAERRVREVSV
jgi:peptide/nickel transport system ATP-binding protein